MTKTNDYTRNFKEFFRDVYLVEGDYVPRPLCPPFLSTWLDIAFPLPDGDPVASNIMDLRNKKQGKSATAGAVGLYMALRKPYSEVVIIAADKDQAKDRVLRSIKYAVEHGPLSDHAKVLKDAIEFDNKSVILAMPSDWQSSAGGNYSAVLFDELHAWTYESQRRIFDELIIPPTQKAGVRWVASYAGFEGESNLLKDWWKLAEQGQPISQELPIFHNKQASLLAFIDKGEASWRMPWMTTEYIDSIRTTERPNTFRRIWLNEWVSSESQFIPTGSWEACYSDEVKPLLPGQKRRIVVGADASTSRDLTALVGVEYNQKSASNDVVFTRVWKPKKGILRFGKPTIDLEETIGAEVIRLHKEGQLAAVILDPYQLHTLAIKWEKMGIKVIELAQNAGRVESDQALHDSIIGGSIRHYNDPVLNEHIKNAVAVETARGIRLAKEKTSQKIDGAVALSMALHGALDHRKILDQPKMGFVVDPFADWPPPDNAVYNPFVGWIPVENSLPHPEGVTWENCKFRQKGCLACIQELDELGFYEQCQEEEKEIIRAGYHTPAKDWKISQLSDNSFYNVNLEESRRDNAAAFIRKLQSKNRGQ
jgi:hypothetical protein